MRKILTLMAMSAIFAGCSSIKQKPKRISPIPATYTVSALNNCTIPTSFTSDDFNWMGGNLRATIYRETFYTSDDIKSMQLGDTLVYEGKPMVVKKIEKESGTISINGGVEEGGAWLNPDKNMRYRATTLDDHSIYDELGKAEMPLAEDFTVVDCGENPTDPYDTIRTGQKIYIESLKDYKREFWPTDTRVRIENGVVKEIVRRWVP